MIPSPSPSAPQWMALPTPTTVELSGGLWRAPSVDVRSETPWLRGEADRLRGELAALGLGPGPGPVVRFRAAPDLAGEAFTVVVGEDVEIGAGSAAGAFRGARQVLHNLRAQAAVPRGRVASAPAVGERGVHLDAGRANYPAAWIVDLLHACADVGINAFQWHVSENEGFRVASDAFPEIVSAEHITRAEARRIADEAARLHIELIPSLDMPGHLRHVLAAHPEHRLRPGGDTPPVDHALDLASPAALRFATDLIDDIAPLFPASTQWHLGADEVVDFAAMADYPALGVAARQRFGPGASGFDLLTAFVNHVAGHLRSRGLGARVWNDGMLRSDVVALDPGVVLTWWTNWQAEMRPLAAAEGRPVVNFDDGHLYFVLGEAAGYRYPTSQAIWAADWHPGTFPSLPGGVGQEVGRPYPDWLAGAFFSVWSDRPDALTPAEVAAAVRRPVRAMAERAWNAGSPLTHAQFTALDDRIGRPAPREVATAVR